MGKIFLVKLPNHFRLFPDKLNGNTYLYLNGLLQGRKEKYNTKQLIINGIDVKSIGSRFPVFLFVVTR